MIRTPFPLALLAALALSPACGDDDGGTDDGADDGMTEDSGTDDSGTGDSGTGDSGTGDSGTEAMLLGVEGLVVTECAGDTGAGSELYANQSGANQIGVSHVGWDMQCCAEIQVDAVLAGETVAVTYTDVSDEPCDCMCAFEAVYDITGVPTGTWTVDAGEAADTVTVGEWSGSE